MMNDSAVVALLEKNQLGLASGASTNQPVASRDQIKFEQLQIEKPKSKASHRK